MDIASQYIIGSGGFADVVHIHGNDYVQKRLKDRFKGDENKIKLFTHEQQMLRKIATFKCPYILRLHSTSSLVNSFKIRLQALLPPWRELFYLVETYAQSDTKRIIQRVLPKLVDAIECLHNHGIVHRDIKPENIMIHPETLDLRLIDFGFACDKDSSKLLVGTPTYFAPDMIIASDNTQIFLMEAMKQFDLWSLGMTIYVLVHGNFPFNIMGIRDEIKNMIRIYYNNPKMPGITKFSSRKQKQRLQQERNKFLEGVAPKYRKRVDYMNYLQYNQPGEYKRCIPQIAQIAQITQQIEKLSDCDTSSLYKYLCKSYHTAKCKKYPWIFRWLCKYFPPTMTEEEKIEWARQWLDQHPNTSYG